MYKSNKINLLIFIVLLVLLIILTILVNTNVTYTLDINVYNLIHKLFCHPLTIFFKFITFFASVPFIIFLCSILIIFLPKKGRGLNLSCCIIFTTILTHVIKLLVKRPRPIYMDSSIAIEKTYSFPSGHTSAITAVVGVIIYCLWHSKISKKIKIFLTILSTLLSILIMISRIYLGVHYFTDILGGIITALLVLSLFKLILDFQTSPLLKK